MLWAVATRMQADRDLVVIAGSLGAMLDPSADERGVTAKLGIDATRPFGQPFADKLVMPPEKMAWARSLVDRLSRDRRRRSVKRYIDLSVTVDNATLSPPSTNMRLEITPHRRGPGFWQVSSVNQSLHTGAHIDSPLHVFKDGITTAEIALDQVMGEAVVVDLSFAGANHAITIDDLKRGGADDVRHGDIVLLRTDWTDKMYGRWPDYFTQSPYFPPESAEWLVARGPRTSASISSRSTARACPDFRPRTSRCTG